jgi:hypothetical protein
MRWISPLAFLSLLLTLACTDSAPPPSVTSPLHRDLMPASAVGSIGDSVITPSGVVPRRCAAEVASGSTIHRRDSTVTLPNGKSLMFANCLLCPPFRDTLWLAIWNYGDQRARYCGGDWSCTAATVKLSAPTM